MACIKTELKVYTADLVGEIVEGVVASLDSRIFSAEPRQESLLDVPSMAKYLSVAEAWVYQRVHANEIPHFKLGKYIRFRRAEVETWLQSKQEGRRKPTQSC